MKQSELLEKIELEILPAVKKPARYTGGEWNMVKKDWQGKVHTALAFPDVYEVGMSNLGFIILYHLINEIPYALCERVFAPWTDMEQKLLEHGVPLYSLESRRPLRDFDLIGFSLSYEMSYTNILTMLSLGKIPWRAAHRTESDPFVIAGGGCTCNPEPIAEVFDFIVIGEGEEVIVEILDKIHEWKESGARKRGQFLRELADIKGVYVPSLHRVEYRGDQGWRTEPIGDAPMPVRRRYVRNLNTAFYPLQPILPTVQAVHDRANLEVFRGCIRGCRFCQAGIIYRPHRERSSEELLRIAKAHYESCGMEEISLLSLNTTDYTPLPQLLQELVEFAAPQEVSISLPSTRLDSFTEFIGREVRCVRPTGLTFAPEAGTQRLRDVVKKQITEEEIIEGLKASIRAGWQRVKFYFMIGLPTETMDDVDAIPELVGRMIDAARGVAKGRVKFSVSVSNFVPKPHTPFQWLAMDSKESLLEKQKLLRRLMRWKNVELKLHDVNLNYLEAVFSRGDRRLLPVLEEAWRLGCRFDGWGEKFSTELWLQAFRHCDLDPDFYARTEYPLDAPLPWSHISVGVSEKFLKQELFRSRK
ncbi:MAG: TIGR03960 family B12-binding radical SAM protein [bacterium]